MNSLFIKSLIILVSFSMRYSYGQFTYLEVGLSSTNVLYGKEAFAGIGPKKGATYNGFNLRINAVSRIIRNFGVGVELSIPLAQKNSFGFSDSPTQPNGYFFGFEDAVNNNRYVPQQFDYTFKNSISGSVFGRVYLSTFLNPYFDVKLSFVSMTERFVFKRDEIPAAIIYGDFVPKIPASDIDYEMKHKLLVPGLALGLQPHVSEKLFINFSIGVDFYSFKNDPFSYGVLYDWDRHNNSPKIVTLESKASGMKAGILINLGMGYFF